MIKFKFDVSNALKTAGFSSYAAKQGGGISQDTWRKIKAGDAAHISIKALDSICRILDMQPSHLIYYEPDQACQSGDSAEAATAKK